MGIDVSASRGLDLCTLDDRRRVVLLVKARDLGALEPILRALPRASVIAIDAPSGPAQGLVPGRDYRVAEREVRNRTGLSLYPTPSSVEAAKSWMREGFELFRLLAEIGFSLFTHGDSRTGVAIEVYPHLSYVALSGTRRGAAAKLEWSRAVVRGRVSGLPPDAGQDALDAACAALTAWHFAHGSWVAFGDPSEGVIVAPAPRGDRAKAEPAAADQLTLPIDAARAQRGIRAPRPSSFAERIAALAAQIPVGRVATYGDVARWAGKPAAARAVGTVLGARAFEVPCHRVVSADGAPPPYPADAADRLRAEGVPLRNGRVDLAAARWSGPA